MEKKLIDIIIPVYGKDIKIIENFLVSIPHKKCGSKVRFILVYKNSKKFNYDALEKFSSENVVIIKAEENDRRTKKIIIGIKKSNSDYLLFMDSHHTIKFNKMDRFLKELESKSFDLAFMKVEEFNLDKKRSNISDIFATTAGRYIIKSNLIKKQISDIDFDVIFHDDWTMGLLALFENKIINIIWINSIIYRKTFGKNISNTKNKVDKVSSLNKFEDSKIILNYFGKKINVNEIYNPVFWIMFYKLLIDCFRNYLSYKGKKFHNLPKEDVLKVLEHIFEEDLMEKLVLMKIILDKNSIFITKGRFLIENENFDPIILEGIRNEKK